MTVSNVVNGRVHEMGEVTRLRVEEAMRELDYTPNFNARGLRVQKTNTLAFLLLDPEPNYLADPMTDLIVSGVGAVARERGYMLLIHAVQPGEFDRGLLLPILQGRVDGALLLLSGNVALRHRYIDEVRRLTSNIVAFEDLDDPEVSTVTAENRAAAFEVTEGLIREGHRRIAFLGTANWWPMIEQRFAGYRDALDANSIEFDEELTRFEGDWNAATGERMTAKLRDLADPATAIVAGNDLLAIGSMKALKARGLQVARDVSVVGFDDFVFSEHVDPPLTTVRVPGFEMGHRAASILIDRAEGIEVVPAAERFQVELMVRRSALTHP